MIYCRKATIYATGRAEGSMVDGVEGERLSEGRQLRTMGGGVGGGNIYGVRDLVRIRSLVTFYAKST
jgi:hypothetical protein